MKKTILLICSLIASICINAEPVKIGDLFYTLYSSDLTAVVASAPSGESYEGLTTLTLPATVTYEGKVYSVLSVEGNAFGKCPNLETVYWNIVNCGRTYYSNEHPFYASSRTTQFKHIIFGEGVKTIPMYVCYKQYELEDVVIPSSVTRILRNAFAGCSKLQTAVLPEGLTTLGISAFLDCSKLTSVNIPASLTEIQDFAFQGCSQLASIDLHEGITSIGNEAFLKCAFTELTVPSTATSVGDNAFASITSLKTVYWNPTTGRTYGSTVQSPFYNSTGVTKFVLGNDVKHIPAYLCYDMSGLTEITIPASVQSIGLGAFYKCSGLKEVVLPEGVTRTDGSSFKSCSNLQSVTIPNSLKQIENYTFQYCSKLTSINLHDDITRIGTEAFSETGLKTVTIPRSVTSLGEAPFRNCAKLTKVYWKATNTTCSGYSDTHPFYQSTGIKTVVFSGNVEKIPNVAFYNASSLSLIINFSILPQTINANVFYNVNKETCELWVPEVSMDLYLVADVWKDFAKQAKAPAVESEFEDVACDSYTWAEKTFMESGDYKDTLHTELGQDSIITLHLTINHSTFGEESQEAEGSYEWHDVIYTQSGDYEYKTTNTAGCDSIVTLHLTITEPEIPTALPSAKDEQVYAEKILRDGQLYIRRKENTYTATGLKVE